MRTSFFMLIALLLALSACGPKTTPAATLDLTAIMAEISGDVQMRQAAGAFTAAAEGASLSVGGQVRTGDDGRARLDLSTGTRVRVAPSSLFTLASNVQQGETLNTRFQLDLGRIWIILNGGSAEVTAPSGVASVRGSYLMVALLPEGGVRITCLEGTCGLSNASGSVSLSNGQSAIITDANLPPQVGQMTPEDFQDWLDNNPEAALVMEPTAIPTATATSTPLPPPTPTATSTPLPTSGEGVLREAAACRIGPGTVFVRVAYLMAGQRVRVTGISLDGEWLAIENPEREGTCWVNARAVELTFNPAGLPPLAGPATPTPIPPPPLIRTVRGPMGVLQTCQNTYEAEILPYFPLAEVLLYVQYEDANLEKVVTVAFPMTRVGSVYQVTLSLPTFGGCDIEWWIVATDTLGLSASTEHFLATDMVGCWYYNY